MEKISQGHVLSQLSEAADESKAQLNRTVPHGAYRSLRFSASLWFICVMAGQWFFFYYIFAFYGVSVVNDNMEIWNRWEPLGSKPYVAGDLGGNLAFAAHAIGAGIVAFGGALQLIPWIRSQFPRFHKINGYVYLITVFALAMSGFYLVGVRGTSPNDLSAMATTVNGCLILGCAYLTVCFAINRDIKRHRKWAIRLFLVANAQWFLRVGVFAYFVIAPLFGITPNFKDDLFFPLWTLGCFLLPLAAAQLYFYAVEKGGYWAKYLTSGVIVLLSLIMLTGITAFTPFLHNLISGGTLG